MADQAGVTPEKQAAPPTPAVQDHIFPPEIDSNTRSLKILYTSLLYLTYTCSGLMNVASTTLLDMAELTNSTTAELRSVQDLYF